jgi:hypothetical protein
VIVELAPREIACACGHVTTLTSRKLLCIKCGKYVFYDEKERKAHRFQSWYVTAVIVGALALMVYFFVELVIHPLRLLE